MYNNKKKEDNKNIKDIKKSGKPSVNIPPPNPIQNNNTNNVKTRISSASNNNSKKIENPNQQNFQDSNQQLMNFIKDFLLKQGYNRTIQTLKSEKIIKKPIKNEISQQNSTNLIAVILILMEYFEKGSRDEFFKQWNKIYFNSQDQTIKKLEFQLNIYFYIYAIHPQIKKSNVIDKATVEYFKRYLETKGSQLSKTNEFLSFYALPYIQKPQQHPAISHIFTRQWLQKIKAKLVECLNSNSRVSFTQKKTALEEIFSLYLNNIKQCKNCEHMIELQQLKTQNNQIINYLSNVQNHYKSFSQSAKANLLESQGKWFQFAKQILILAKKATKGEKIESKIQKYQQFFNHNVQDLLLGPNQVSIFDRPSYLTQQVSINPQQERPSFIKKNENLVCPIDLSKIIKKLNQDSQKDEKQIQICLILQALRWRFTKLKNPYTRRQVIISYSMQDLCGIKKQNFRLQEKLLFKAPTKVRECFLRLLNYITSDYYGITYLIQEDFLIQNLMRIFRLQKEETISKKHSLGVLQKLTLLKKPQIIMVKLEIIEIIINMLKNQISTLSQYSLQYMTALLMNLSLRKVGRQRFQLLKVELVKLLYDFLLVDNDQIRNYINGTIYSFISSSVPFKEECMKIGMEKRMKQLMANCEENLFMRQYQYIIEKLNSNETDQEEIYTDEQNQLQFDDIEEQEENILSDDDKSSQYLDEEEHLNGQELLMKQYALLGPDGMKQQFMTKEIMDQTSIRKQNLTTSINKSRRVQLFGARPVTPSLNGIDNQLSRSLIRFGKGKTQSLN